MSLDPPEPLEFAERVISDTYQQVRIDVAVVIARVVEELRNSDHWHPLIHGEELATREIDELWYDENLADAYARALAEVHEQYLVQAARVLEVVADLETEGRESWIARALRHRFAFDVSWDAQDRLGLLERFDADALCAACGAELRNDEDVVEARDT